jgi:hypothetical protein
MQAQKRTIKMRHFRVDVTITAIYREEPDAALRLALKRVRAAATKIDTPS